MAMLGGKPQNFVFQISALSLGRARSPTAADEQQRLVLSHLSRCCDHNLLMSRKVQCEIIQGRLVGKLLAPFLPRAVNLEGRLEQHAQPVGCAALYSASALGACALRSLVACARRRSGDIVAQYGAVSSTRGASILQPGHCSGSSHSAIGRMAVNGPQSLHIYS